MKIETIETAWLGNRSYVVVDDADPDRPVAIAIDPPRDVDRVQQLLDTLGARLLFVVETHWHADYVSGGLQLAREQGATYAVPPADPSPGFSAERVIDGAEFAFGSLNIRALHTPGHTAHHMSYVLSDESAPLAAFTGGSLLHVGVGRTDLADPSLTRSLT